MKDVNLNNIVFTLHPRLYHWYSSSDNGFDVTLVLAYYPLRQKQELLNLWYCSEVLVEACLVNVLNMVNY